MPMSGLLDLRRWGSVIMMASCKDVLVSRQGRFLDNRPLIGYPSDRFSVVPAIIMATLFQE